MSQVTYRTDRRYSSYAMVTFPRNHIDQIGIDHILEHLIMESSPMRAFQLRYGLDVEAYTSLDSIDFCVTVEASLLPEIENQFKKILTEGIKEIEEGNFDLEATKAVISEEIGIDAYSLIRDQIYLSYFQTSVGGNPDTIRRISKADIQKRAAGLSQPLEVFLSGGEEFLKEESLSSQVVFPELKAIKEVKNSPYDINVVTLLIPFEFQAPALLHYLLTRHPQSVLYDHFSRPPWSLYDIQSQVIGFGKEMVLEVAFVVQSVVSKTFVDDLLAQTKKLLQNLDKHLSEELVQSSVKLWRQEFHAALDHFPSLAILLKRASFEGKKFDFRFPLEADLSKEEVIKSLALHVHREGVFIYASKS